MIELLDAISDLALEAVEPNEKATALRSESAKASSKRSRYIPNKIKREVWKQANIQCQFISPETQRKCKSTHRLQIEHMAVKLLGEKKMELYLQKALPS